ncbi:AraC family transcriptional regulator [Paenibacillus thalictri]|uniref:AraC family transcriptional regulator n=1 Tax=Paenibacillus thalictri TaxID=2527873 RepID=A0A4Q9DCN3_9BACL|nr:AraC family transcriptional regulator [Paenibacillus thalictri]
MTVSTIGEKVGFMNDNYFIKIFKRWVGTTPSEYRTSQTKTLI